jgi:[ribosomal protein S5]-alanine N-acetyltransferase
LILHGNAPADEPELAYELLRAAHGCSYATEAGQAVVTRASEAGYRRLRATVWDWNVASRRVLEKLGFRKTGRVEPDSVYGHSLLTVRDF